MSRNPIQDNFVILCNELDLGRVLPVLCQAKMLTPDEYEMLTNTLRPTKQRRELLLLLLPRKGSDHFQIFGRCLVWAGQAGLAHRIGVDVERVPPPPANLSVPQPQPQPQPQSQEQMHHMLQSLIASGTLPAQAGTVLTPPTAPPTTVPHPHHLSPSEHSSPPVHTPRNMPQPPKLRRPVGDKPPTVFLLYCKDPNNRTQYEVWENVMDLADVLNRCGGIVCEYDGYDKHAREANWNKWTEKMIQDSDFVLLVCSPALSKCLQHPEHKLVDMNRGKFYADTIVNLIDPEKFVPVFLNVSPQLKWVPTNLHTSTHYELRVDELMSEMGDTEGYLSRDFTEKLGDLLQQAKFQDIATLLAVLRGEEYYPRPPPPRNPVVLPRPPQPDSSHMHNPGHPYYTRPYHPTVATPTMTPPTATPTTSATQQAEYISDGDLLKVAERLPRDWQHLGIKLGINYSTLESLQAQYPFDTRMATLTMFGTWQRIKKKEATRKSLKQALISLGYGRVAKEVFPDD